MLLPELTITDPLPEVLAAIEASAWDQIESLRASSRLAQDRLADAAAVALEAAAKIGWLRECNPR